MSQPKIYVLQHPVRNGRPLDISDAARYGEMQPPVFSPKYNVLLDVTDAIMKLESALADYCEDDYIIAIGDPVLIGAAMAIGARNAGGKVKLLKWNRHLLSNGQRSKTAGNYVPVMVEIDVQ